MSSASERHARFDVSLCHFPRLYLSEVLHNPILSRPLIFQYQPHRSVFENESCEINHLWRIMQMNIEERLAKYLQRDFSLEQSQILVLMEEVAIALFAALPEHFVLFGGATLVLFHNSPQRF